MSHSDTFHAKAVDARLLGPSYALLYVRFNSSPPYDRNCWSDKDIKSHIASTYPTDAIVIADSQGTTNRADWKAGPGTKKGNAIRHLFLLIPLPAGTNAAQYEWHVPDLEENKNASMQVLNDTEVVQWAKTLAYNKLKSLDPNWKPHVAV